MGSYLLCATPRTGSTLLCDLLRSTAVAGRPESYFREPDEAAWRTRLGVPPAAGYRAFAAAVARAGTTPNGVFGARVMWGSLDRLVAGLGPGETDLQALETAFGPLQLIHLRRDDAVGQAVSWARAEQTGYWQHGDTATTTPRLDVDQIDALVRTVHEHEAAWADWFAGQGVRPHHVTYEELVRDPGAAVRGILTHLGVRGPDGWTPVLRHRRQADDLNAAWVSAHRAAGRAVVRRRTGGPAGEPVSRAGERGRWPDRSGIEKQGPRATLTVTAMDITIHSSFLPQDDPEAAVAFYRDALGFEVRNDVGYNGMHWITVGPVDQPGTSIVLYPPAASPGITDDERRTIAEMMAKGTYGSILLATKDLDDTFARVQATDAEVVQEPTEQPYGVRDCAFRDPAGNMVRIQEQR